MTVAQTLAVTGAVTLSSTVQATSFKVGGTQVVGPQGGPVFDCNAASSAAGALSAGQQLNALLAALRTHGLIPY